MKKKFSSIVILLITFINKFPLYSSEDNSVLDYYRGDEIKSEDDSEEPNDCICDTNIGSCDYFCCCDKDCHEDAIKEWRDRHKCIDEQDTVGIFADRCIDQHLVVFSNNRRGLKKDIQSEDIPNRDATINNYCYSMDNSGKMTKNIQSLNNLKDFEINNEKFDQLINKINQENIDINTNSQNKDNKKHDYLKIQIDKDFFTILDSSENKYFSLFSGSTCQTSKKVEMLVPESYSCLMKKKEEKLTEEILNSITINDIKDPKIETYYIRNGILKKGKDTSFTNIVEVEFIVQMNKSKYKIEKICINIVYRNEEDYYPFKNSIKFIQEECGDDNNLKKPYRYSGNGGYLNNYPLKIYNLEKNKVYNEYFIVGRDENGNCRDFSEDIDEYLYDSDIPINFKQDYSYHCTKKQSNTNLKDTLLYTKINGIRKIGRYGSSFYNNINDEEDWVTVNHFEYKNDFNTIKMNVYIGTKKIGYYSHKYIYRTDILYSKEENGQEYWFNIKYYDLEGDDDNDKKYNKSPEYPTFVPNIPEDILDPLINSDVDK